MASDPGGVAVRQVSCPCAARISTGAASAAAMKPPATIVLLAFLLNALAAPAGAQDAPGQPTFRSSVDLVPVDVNVIDRTGRPVTGLEAGDFALTIDGKARRIASAQYVTAAEASAPPAPTYYSSKL